MLWDGLTKDQLLSSSLDTTFHPQDVVLLVYTVLPGNRPKLSKYLLQNINYSFRSTVNSLFSCRS